MTVMKESYHLCFTSHDEVLFRDGMALTIGDVKPYLVTNQQADQNFRCYQWLMGYIASNPRRFDDTEDNKGELWGVREDGVVYFIRTAFERALSEEGYSSNTFLSWAKMHGKIEYESYERGSTNNRLTKRKRINGHPVTCVAIRTDDWEGEIDVTQDEEEMPF